METEFPFPDLGALALQTPLLVRRDWLDRDELMSTAGGGIDNGFVGMVDTDAHMEVQDGRKRERNLTPGVLTPDLVRHRSKKKR